MQLSEQNILSALRAVQDPDLHKNIVELNFVQNLKIEGDKVSFDLRLTTPACPIRDQFKDQCIAIVKSLGASEVNVTFTAQGRVEGSNAATQAPKVSYIGEVSHVVAVASGKGGVGKSTVTANLAVALAAQGLSVGLVDADVHGFSIPGLLGIPAGTQPTRIDDLMLPPVAHGVKTISIGMFLRDGEAVVAWRGPMLHRTVQQFLTDVFFGDLDILLIDMPPGTGDIAISIGQLLPHAEVLVVTTPQAAASDVAIRSGLVARQTGQRVIGVVENMGALTLPDGTVVDLFGSGGGAAVADALSETQSVPLLASIPLSPALRTGGDEGVPVVLSAPEDAAAVAIRDLAASLATQGRGLAGRSLPMTLG